MRAGMRIGTMLLAVAVLCMAVQASAKSGVTSAEFGKTADGRTVHVFTLTNRRGMTAQVLDLGGIIHQLNVPDRSGKLGNVVLSLDSIADYEKFPSANSLVGRFANRIKNGFTVGGKHFDLPGNAAGVNLHSGPDSYYKRIWTAAPLKANQAALTLSLDSPDGDQGFPGHLRVSVTYTLTDANELRLYYVATTDKDTFINFTNHIYVNLAGDLTQSIFDQQLQVNAATFTELDKDAVPTGRLLPVAGTALDFLTPHKVGERVAAQTAPDYSTVRGYDFNWVLDDKARGEKPVAVRMSDPVTGRVLELSTTEPGVQIFSAPGLPPVVHAAGNVKVARGVGLALETQHFPDSPNHPEFPTTLLKAGQNFRSVTVFRFTTEK